MLKIDKVAWVAKHQERFAKTDFAFVFRCEKINSEDMGDLRAAIKKAGGSMVFVKNTLARIAVEGTNCSALKPLFKGVSVLVTSANNTNEDEYVGLTKALQPFLKAHKKNMSLAGGVLLGNFMDSNALDAFSKMPSRLELLGGIAMLLRYPLINIADTIERAGASKN